MGRREERGGRMNEREREVGRREERGGRMNER